MRALRTGDTARATASAKSLGRLTYLSLLVIVTGFGVMGMADPKYDLSITTPWVLGSLILYVIAVALTLGIVIPTYLHPERREPKQRYTRVAVSPGITAICLVAIVVLMVWKP
ncbi:DUF2269 domain-containing protein [Microbacterium memoriense]|uniref:DUF2269 domain-containing protein n=1 Tax=Microbacterium memoriense TaxID=2978350 RepID=A0ABT2PF08_9MICO|nr:DUF2269 domain-containing protein [Microbacterium memoriense]MCT9003056.1 DUF2269 domain-containing protein [Microbacterium memoriense]